MRACRRACKIVDLNAMSVNLDGIPRSGYIFKVCLIVLLLFVDLVINNTADANDLGANGATNPIIFIGFVFTLRRGIICDPFRYASTGICGCMSISITRKRFVQ